MCICLKNTLKFFWVTIAVSQCSAESVGRITIPVIDKYRRQERGKQGGRGWVAFDDVSRGNNAIVSHLADFLFPISGFFSLLSV